MAYVLQMNNITKKINDSIIVNSINLNIKSGEIYGLIGSNGAGKTTIMKMIVGLTMKNNGDIKLFESTDLVSGRKRIGAIIETPALYESMTAQQNLELIMTLIEGPVKFDIPFVLGIVGLENERNKKVKDFSLGMKQRLGLAMTLLGSPEFLILDEPINGLDPAGMREFREVVVRLNKQYGLTILISSHILNELFKLATVYGIVVNGSLVTELDSGSIEELSAKTNIEEYLIKKMESKDD